MIASIMCGYSKEDWIELAQMSEVGYKRRLTRVLITCANLCFLYRKRVPMRWN